MALISVLDSFYLYISQQIATLDPTQQMGGIIQARDWPQTPPLEGALYLLVLGGVPVENGASTQSQNMYEFTCQWTWYFQGSDIAGYQQASNRGDRYRRSMQVVNLLRNAHYPGFCYKTNLSVDSQGNLTQAPISDAIYGGAEVVRWTLPRFIPTQDQKAGLLYETATVRVYGIDDILPSVQ
jgi:hypothetical protein